MPNHRRLLEALTSLMVGVIIGYSLFAPEKQASAWLPDSNSRQPGKSQAPGLSSDRLSKNPPGRTGATLTNSGTFEVDRQSWYRTQKKLQSINPVPVFDWKDVKLSQKLCEALEIAPDKKGRLDAVLGLAMHKIIELEKRNATRKVTPDGEILEVAAYAGGHLKEELFHAIEGIIEEPASITLQALLENDRLFGGFGQFRQEIWLQEPFDGKLQADSPLYLYAMYYDAAGHPTTGLNARAMSRNQYLERYGLALGKGQ